MRRTGVNTAASLIPCALTYTSELLSREESEALGVKLFGNATAVSSLDSLLVPNGDYSLEFNWCDTSELLSREVTEAWGVKLFGKATAVSSLDSLLVPNGDYSLALNRCDTNGVNSCRRLMST